MQLMKMNKFFYFVVIILCLIYLTDQRKFQYRHKKIYMKLDIADSAEKAQAKIRNKGTIILNVALLQPQNSSNSTNDSAPAKAVNASQGSENANDSIKIFDGEKMEIPKICKLKLSKKELILLARSASKYVNAWLKAGAKPTGNYYELPFLNAEQLAAFYKEIATNVTLQGDQLKPDDAAGKKAELLKTVLFGNGNRTDICWLEFWIYMCADGLEPEVNEVALEQDDRTKLQEQFNHPKIKNNTVNSTNSTNSSSGAAAGGAAGKAAGGAAGGAAAPAPAAGKSKRYSTARKSVHHEKHHNVINQDQDRPRPIQFDRQTNNKHKVMYRAHM